MSLGQKIVMISKNSFILIFYKKNINLLIFTKNKIHFLEIIFNSTSSFLQKSVLK